MDRPDPLAGAPAVLDVPAQQVDAGDYRGVALGAFGFPSRPPPFRAAAREAVEQLGHTAVLAEDFGAQPRSPQIACLDGLRQSALTILIIGDRYGAKQSSGLSGPDFSKVIPAPCRLPQRIELEIGAVHTVSGKMTIIAHDYPCAVHVRSVIPKQLPRLYIKALSNSSNVVNRHISLRSLNGAYSPRPNP
jgi:hypothetical protein